jgi:hypothetical protein
MISRKPCITTELRQTVQKVQKEFIMRPNEIIRDINRLNLSEQFRLVEDIWDSIVHNHARLAKIRTRYKVS